MKTKNWKFNSKLLIGFFFLIGFLLGSFLVFSPQLTKTSLQSVPVTSSVSSKEAWEKIKNNYLAKMKELAIKGISETGNDLTKTVEQASEQEFVKLNADVKKELENLINDDQWEEKLNNLIEKTKEKRRSFKNQLATNKANLHFLNQLAVTLREKSKSLANPLVFYYWNTKEEKVIWEKIFYCLPFPAYQRKDHYYCNFDLVDQEENLTNFWSVFIGEELDLSAILEKTTIIPANPEAKLFQITSFEGFSLFIASLDEKTSKIPPFFLPLIDGKQWSLLEKLLKDFWWFFLFESNFKLQNFLEPENDKLQNFHLSINQSETEELNNPTTVSEKNQPSLAKLIAIEKPFKAASWEMNFLIKKIFEKKIVPDSLDGGEDDFVDLEEKLQVAFRLKEEEFQTESKTEPLLSQLNEGWNLWWKKFLLFDLLLEKKAIFYDNYYWKKAKEKFTSFFTDEQKKTNLDYFLQAKLRELTSPSLVDQPKVKAIFTSEELTTIKKFLLRNWADWELSEVVKIIHYLESYLFFSPEKPLYQEIKRAATVLTKITTLSTEKNLIKAQFTNLFTLIKKLVFFTKSSFLEKKTSDFINSVTVSDRATSLPVDSSSLELTWKEIFKVLRALKKYQIWEVPIFSPEATQYQEKTPSFSREGIIGVNVETLFIFLDQYENQLKDKVDFILSPSAYDFLGNKPVHKIILANLWLNKESFYENALFLLKVKIREIWDKWYAISSIFWLKKHLNFSLVDVNNFPLQISSYLKNQLLHQKTFKQNQFQEKKDDFKTFFTFLQQNRCYFSLINSYTDSPRAKKIIDFLYSKKTFHQSLFSEPADKKCNIISIPKKREIVKIVIYPKKTSVGEKKLKVFSVYFDQERYFANYFFDSYKLETVKIKDLFQKPGYLDQTIHFPLIAKPGKFIDKNLAIYTFFSNKKIVFQLLIEHQKIFLKKLIDKEEPIIFNLLGNHGHFGNWSVSYLSSTKKDKIQFIFLPYYSSDDSQKYQMIYNNLFLPKLPPTKTLQKNSPIITNAQLQLLTEKSFLKNFYYNFFDSYQEKIVIEGKDFFLHNLAKEYLFFLDFLDQQPLITLPKLKEWKNTIISSDLNLKFRFFQFLKTLYKINMLKIDSNYFFSDQYKVNYLEKGKEILSKQTKEIKFSDRFIFPENEKILTIFFELNQILKNEKKNLLTILETKLQHYLSKKIWPQIANYHKRINKIFLLNYKTFEIDGKVLDLERLVLLKKENFETVLSLLDIKEITKLLTTKLAVFNAKTAPIFDQEITPLWKVFSWYLVNADRKKFQNNCLNIKKILEEPYVKFYSKETLSDQNCLNQIFLLDLDVFLTTKAKDVFDLDANVFQQLGKLRKLKIKPDHLDEILFNFIKKDQSKIVKEKFTIRAIVIISLTSVFFFLLLVILISLVVKFSPASKKQARKTISFV